MSLARYLLLLSACGLAVLAGCVHEPSTEKVLRVTDSVLTSGDNIAHGDKSPVQTFSTSDLVVAQVVFEWDAVKKSAGQHSVEWNWYQGNDIVSRSEKSVEFKTTPFTLTSSRQASSLGTGHFRVETVVDGVIESTSEFDILP
ncbi:MAG: hypothetical protein ISP79_06625 [Methylophilaceae bacterium]|nr:hypothetical protein [Methylophilaceae bacterium]MBL6750734.1 hypothetical protein [Nevskia sp.]